MSEEIWVVAQTRGTECAPVTYEVMAAALALAKDLGGTVCVFVPSAHGETMAAELFARGAVRVYWSDTGADGGFRDDLIADALCAAARAHSPAAILGAATSYGKALFPRVAALLSVGLIPDVTGVDGSSGHFAAFRPCFGGNVVRQMSANGNAPVLATVRPKVFPPVGKGDSGTGELIKIEISGESGMTIKESVSEKGQTVNLSEADVVVSGGRGLREPENFKLVYDLAAATGGAVGASRAVVDADWIAYAHQIGQTGKTVNPKLYFALGISGAIQHLVGMQSSRVIVAVNKDPDAPIFKVATFGIVGDVNEFAPALTQVFKERLGT
jgi:electron transfer flavoprotein alpha subunit